ncbi:MAG: hypothetical protein M1831_001299 [Alyxoria varia]|nr:MAG: hypothetical protein M1831_001299 [Alyxoria varia]
MASSRCEVPKSIQHDITELDKERILCGCASPNGDVLAVLEKSGGLHILFLGPQRGGGLRCVERVKPKKELCRQERASVQSLRFRPVGRQLELHAIDVKGKILIHRFDLPQDM